MTTTLGSVDRRPGHIRISTANLWPSYISNEGREIWRMARPMVSVDLHPVPYRFIGHDNKIYYVNGRKQIYETDILNIAGVLFKPVGYQFLDDRCWHPIQFRLMSKVELVFL